VKGKKGPPATRRTLDVDNPAPLPETPPNDEQAKQVADLNKQIAAARKRVDAATGTSGSSGDEDGGT
jgi:hypothetical protein